MKRTLINGAAIAAALVIGVVGTASATSLIGHGHIKDSAVHSDTIKDGAVHRADLNHSVARALTGHTIYVSRFGSQVNARAGDESGLHMTGEGAHFGPFVDGGACTNGGSDFARLNFEGLDGVPLGKVHQLDFTGLMTSTDNTGGVGSLTMRVYLNSGTDRLTFSPNTQYNTPADYADAQGETHTWLTTLGTWRLNDDAGENPAGELPFSHWASAGENGGDLIDHVDILLGCEAGANLQGVVRSIQANGTDYVLGKIG